MTPCLFCGGNRDEPDHGARCDGRQGRVEANSEANLPPTPARTVPRGWSRDAYEEALKGQTKAASSLRSSPEGQRFGQAVWAAIYATGLRCARFTVDDVRAAAPTLSRTDWARFGSALGPMLKWAAKDGWIRSTRENQRSGVASTHGHYVAVWESQIYKTRVQ